MHDTKAMSLAGCARIWGFMGSVGLTLGCGAPQASTPEGGAETSTPEEDAESTTESETGTDPVDMSSDTGPADCGLPSTVMPMVEVPTLATSDQGVAIQSAYSRFGEAALVLVAENPFDPEAKHSVQRWSADEVIWEVEVPREPFAVAIDEASGDTMIAGGVPIDLRVHDLAGELVQEATLVGLEGTVDAVEVAGEAIFVAGRDDSQLWVARVVDFAVDWVVPALDPMVQGRLGLAVSEGIVLVAYRGEGVALHVSDGTQAWSLDVAARVITTRTDGGFLVAGMNPAEVTALDLDGTQVWTTAVSAEHGSEATSIQVHGDAAWLSVIPWRPTLGWADAPVDLGAVKLDGTACAAVPVLDVYESHSPHLMIVNEDDSLVLVGIGCPGDGLWCGLVSTRVI